MAEAPAAPAAPGQPVPSFKLVLVGDGGTGKVSDGLSGISGSRVVETLAFAYAIEALYSRPADRQEPGTILKRHVTSILKKTLKQLYFPAHINGNHWVPFCVDFEEKTLAYGELMSCWHN